MLKTRHLFTASARLRRGLHGAPSVLLCGLLALLIATATGCRSTEAAIPTALSTMADGDQLSVFATVTKLHPVPVAADAPEGAPKGATMTMHIHQVYEGGTEQDELTVSVPDVEALPPQVRDAQARLETVVLVTSERAGSGLTMVAIELPSLRKWQCWKCGRTMQAFRFTGETYEEIRWFCPEHGYRDITFEALE